MILITGGCGYIGSHVAAELINQNYEIIIIDNLANSSKLVISRLEKITNKKILFFRGDLTDRKFVENIFKTYNIKSVFHFAGLKSIKQSIIEPSKYFLNNVTSSRNLIDTMIKYGVNEFIFSSSATVYDYSNEVPWTENSPIDDKKHPYGNTKKEVEIMLKQISSKNTNWKVAILRYFNPVGAHKSADLGEFSILNSTNLVPKICTTILGITEFVPIYGNDFKTHDGTGMRDYIHINDLVSGHIMAYKFITKKTGYFIWNLGAGQGYSVLDVINNFSKILKKNINYKFQSRRQGDLDKYWASIKKSGKELNWFPTKKIDDIVYDTYKFICKCKKDLF